MSRSASWSISALLVLVLLAPGALADDGPAAAAELDSRIDKALVQAINTGAQAFNRGDAVACYRIYQGALVGLTPILEHRPDLQETVKQALANAVTNGNYAQKAVALRSALDELRFKVAGKTLWTRLGGEPAVKSVVHDFVVKAASDPKVNFLRDGKYKLDDTGVARLEELLVQLISQVTGGPLKYSGRDMKTTHAGMGITVEEFSATVIDLVSVLKEKNVPEKEIKELIAIIASTRKDMVESAMKPSSPSTPNSPTTPSAPDSLWIRLGGEPAVKSVVHDFVIKAGSDPKVDFTRGGRYSLDADAVVHLEQVLVQQVSSISGGPLKYTGRAMKPVHDGMKITEAQFDAMAADLVSVLRLYKVGDKEIKELIDLIATTKKDIVEVP